MSTDKIDVIKKFFSDTIGSGELKNLFYWLNSEKGNREISYSLDLEWDSYDADATQPVDSSRMLENIKNGIKKREVISLRTSVIKLLPYAAILLIALTISGILYNAPKIFGPSIPNEMNYTTVVVENGQRSKLVLPDSSVVWLNSGSSISYNYDMGNKRREIYLDGQAFFQVARNEQAPFQVHCNDLIVKVLGTKFDVNAYAANQKISVVLESGSVQLLHEQIKNFSYQLKPGEMADYDLVGNRLVTGNADIEKLTSWRDGVLIFKNDPMREVIEKLERWYNIKIDVNDPSVYQSIFTATIRNESFEQILKLIEYTCPVSCQITNGNESGSVPQIVMSKK